MYYFLFFQNKFDILRCCRANKYFKQSRWGKCVQRNNQSETDITAQHNNDGPRGCIRISLTCLASLIRLFVKPPVCNGLKSGLQLELQNYNWMVADVTDFRWFLGRIALANRNILKCREILLSAKVHMIKATVFPRDLFLVQDISCKAKQKSPSDCSPLLCQVLWSYFSVVVLLFCSGQ